MARSDAEIRLILRKLLSGEDNRSGFVGKAFGCLGLIVAVFALFLGIAIVSTLKIDNDIGFWIAMIPAAVGWYLFRSLGKQLNKRRGSRLVEEFKTHFQEGSEDFERAVQFLNTAKSDTGVEKRLLDALDMDIQFDGAPPPGQSQPAKPGPAPKAVHDAFDNFFDSMTASGSPTVTKKMFDLLKKKGKVSGDFEETSWTDENGTHTTVKYKKIYPYNPDNPSAAAAPDGLLGDFETADIGGGDGTPVGDTAPPAAEPQSPVDGGPNAPIDRPPEAAPFLPLDPYARSGKKKDEDKKS